MSADFFNTWKVADEKACSARWSGGKPGEYFRCGLCGHKFVPGDSYLALYTNDMPRAGGNPLMCAKEAATRDEMRTAWAARCAEWEELRKGQRFWYFRKGH